MIVSPSSHMKWKPDPNDEQRHFPGERRRGSSRVESLETDFRGVDRRRRRMGGLDCSVSSRSRRPHSGRGRHISRCRPSTHSWRNYMAGLDPKYEEAVITAAREHWHQCMLQDTLPPSRASCDVFSQPYRRQVDLFAGLFLKRERQRISPAIPTGKAAPSTNSGDMLEPGIARGFAPRFGHAARLAGRWQVRSVSKTPQRLRREPPTGSVIRCAEPNGGRFA